MSRPDMKSCPGYLHAGNISWLGTSCPALNRAAGQFPGGKWYPQNWDMECPTCKNLTVVGIDVEPVEVGPGPDGGYSSRGVNWRNPPTGDRQYMGLASNLYPRHEPDRKPVRPINRRNFGWPNLLSWW